jgi:hypothetical protein
MGRFDLTHQRPDPLFDFVADGSYRVERLTGWVRESPFLITASGHNGA